MKKIKVLFPYVEAGFGHIMPMKAIEETFTKKYGDKVTVISSRFFSETGDPYLIKHERMFADQVRLYNRFTFIGYFVSIFGEMIGTAASTFLSMKLASPPACKKGIEHMRELDPDVVFSTHWATNYYAEKQKENKPYTVMYCPDATLTALFKYRCDLELISMPRGYEKALKYKRYTKDNIKLVPFLIRNEAFDICRDKKQLRKKLGLPEDKFTVLLAEGGYGIGRMEKITKLLIKKHVPMTVIPVCGTNGKLYRRLKSLESTDEVSFYPLPFVDNMLEYQAAADVFCGKSGNIIAEPTFFGNPSVITHFANIIESGIADHYINTVGCAVKQFCAKKAVDMICGYAEDETLLEPYRRAAEAYHEKFGAERAADVLWEAIVKNFPELTSNNKG